MTCSLPTEVLLAICEQTHPESRKQLSKSSRRKQTVGSELDVFTPCVLDLKSFSCASRRFREVAASLLFRNVCIRTREQVVDLVRSKLLVHVSHVHFPVINILTCRRPLGPHIMKLIRQAQSLKVASSDLAFYTDLNRHLGCLLDSRAYLDRLEIYGEVNLPHVDGMSVLADFVPHIPKMIRTLSMTLPGGRPSIAGIESFCSQISPESSEDHPLPKLEHLYLSMHLPLQVVLSPVQLASPLAQRLPSLELIAIAPHKGSQSAVPLHLGDPAGHRWAVGRDKVEVWRVNRGARWQIVPGEDQEQDQVAASVQLVGVNV
ncbi:F-box-like domain protein [Rhizoctonia solani AG-3 Rhs1AP]|uniref:F-box-like domain protein n=1 Tax=Rhizoctonia solani AG-3 Rhs1AP TaxID=1086054 RepID=A0A0A1UIN8_9AGAM|nr:F-box-like domain protein [Rhizoctonia solani AG-3 Rhs1AP]